MFFVHSFAFFALKPAGRHYRMGDGRLPGVATSPFIEAAPFHGPGRKSGGLGFRIQRDGVELDPQFIRITANPVLGWIKQITR